MTEWNHGALSFSSCRERRLRVDFSVGSVSSNGGSLLLREVDRRLGLIAAVARALGASVGGSVTRSRRWCVNAVASGYENLNEHDGLRDDLVVLTACERDRDGDRRDGSGRARVGRHRRSAPRGPEPLPGARVREGAAGSATEVRSRAHPGRYRSGRLAKCLVERGTTSSRSSPSRGCSSSTKWASSP